MLRQKIWSEEGRRLSLDREAEGDSSIHFNHNMDASLIVQKMRADEEKENRPCHSKHTLKTPKRKRILLNAANRMRMAGTRNKIIKSPLTIPPEGSPMISSQAKGETAIFQVGAVANSLNRSNHTTLNSHAYKYTDLKTLKARKITSGSELSIPSPQLVHREREVRDAQVKMLHSSETDQTRIEIIRANAKKKFKASKKGFYLKVDSPFNKCSSWPDYGLCISRHDVDDAMNDYRRAARSLITSEMRNPETYSDIVSEDSTVREFSLASTDMTSEATPVRANTPNSELTGSSFPSFNSSSLHTSQYSSSFSYDSFDDEFKFNHLRSKFRATRSHKSRRENIVALATSRTMHLLDSVADRVCECIAPTYGNSPSTSELIRRTHIEHGVWKNDRERINGNEWNDAFYRKHRFGSNSDKK